MNKYFFLLITLLIFSLQLNAQDMYRVTADKLRIRESSDPKSKIIGFIPQNENVAVLDSANAKYFKVKLTNGEGWVSKEFLTRISSVKKSVQPAAAITASASKAANDNANILFLVVVGLVLVTVLFFAFKYGKDYKFLVGFSLIAVAIISYFCYISFIKQKLVLGTFTSNTDTQYQSFDFKSKDSVTVKDVYTDSLFTTKYIIEGDMIKLYDQQNSILLLIRDDKTLIGEGFTRGTFLKN